MAPQGARAKRSAPVDGWQVTAPLVQVMLGDRAVQFYQGDILPDGVTEESIDHLKGLGYVTRSDAPAADQK